LTTIFTDVCYAGTGSWKTSPKIDHRTGDFCYTVADRVKWLPTLRRSRGWVMQAAPALARPPKYQRAIRLGSAILEQGENIFRTRISLTWHIEYYPQNKDSTFQNKDSANAEQDNYTQNKYSAMQNKNITLKTRIPTNQNKYIILRTRILITRTRI
jgi:hypothetical protein